MHTLIETDAIVSSDQIINAAGFQAERNGKKTVAVAAASDPDVLGALASANAAGILDAVLFGDREKILKAADEDRVDISDFVIEHESNVERAAYGAVKMAAEGKADVVMKGFISTSALLRIVLHRDFDLRTKNTISHTALLDIPGYHKLIQITDGGMVVKPNLEQKLQIMENAVLVARALGLDPVKVAVSGAVDKVYDNIPETTSCRTFLAHVPALDLENVLVQGPLTLDAATSEEIAALKDIDGPVVGDADIYLVDSIEECNIISKALINFADTVFAGVIVGARVPVSLVSRTDTVKNKKTSVALACLVSEYYRMIGLAGGTR
ncbi:MAG: phosphate butyryltransferase [candidate division Zixibacteria bacterium HGW-Zixibacteria-1]|nr:MAG: phosphate butyryltransferase [candidate division Zixibacteria bacterium HGW-Zixibacteria-1]